ncbi:MAG: AraC family transcriptional regulator [Comamonadaceae bacterium]|nr:MAG: AraC family transcriptional regulator [Comamonadaceae bacterium]
MTTQRWLPVGPLLAQLQGMKVLGLDTQRFRARLGPLPEDPMALVPVERYLALWDAALHDYPQADLPTALANAIAFGSLGMLDYLAGSARTLGGCCESLALHLRIVADDTRVELDLLDATHWLYVRTDGHVPIQVCEFTLAMLVLRIRHLVGNSFMPQQTLLPCPRPSGKTLHPQVFGSPIVYDAPLAGIAIRHADWALPVRQADAYLHDMLKGLAKQLALGQSDTPVLEQALRARLCEAIPCGNASPKRLAQLIGLSERTLQRRLSDIGRSFSAVLDDFRHEEAIRLLCDPQLALVQIAARLGFSEQTSFTRAFKRWTSITPAAWRIQHGLERDAHPPAQP